MSRLQTYRAQSEVTGVVLLTGVVAVVALIVGGIIIADTGGGDDGPTTSFVAEATDQTITLTHNGGDTVALADLRVSVSGNDTTREFVPDAANATGSDASLTPGESLTRDHGVPTGDPDVFEVIEVLVVHGPSNTVLFEDEVTVER